jgi:predicted CopG family antitoxin
MVARTISLSEDAYQALAASKRPGESFSDVVRRLVRRRSLTELVGVVDRKAADAIARAVEANRRDRLARRRKELGLS